MTTIKFAQQGVRQQFWKGMSLKDGQILTPGMTFELFYSVDIITETVTIPEGTIGIVHADDATISVIRDDCKAARKAIRLAEASAEELEGIARRKKDRDYKLGCKTEVKQSLVPAPAHDPSLRIDPNKVIKILQTLTGYSGPKEITYTTREKTVKQHTLDDACNAAKAILQREYKYNQLCTDMLKGKSETELLTTVEMSKLVQDLVDDTVYWAGGFTSPGPLV